MAPQLVTKLFLDVDLDLNIRSGSSKLLPPHLKLMPPLLNLIQSGSSNVTRSDPSKTSAQESLGRNPSPHPHPEPRGINCFPKANRSHLANHYGLRAECQPPLVHNPARKWKLGIHFYTPLNNPGVIWRANVVTIY
jgi:hypothetical protein